jgi:hypothetical protein
MAVDDAQAVLSRSRGRCELCGRRGTQIHHRLPRSAGGDDTIDNLLYVCGFGNVDGCHGDCHSHTDRYRNGWLLRTGSVPSEVPVIPKGSP